MRAILTSGWLGPCALATLLVVVPGSTIRAQAPQGATAGLKTVLIPGTAVWSASENQRVQSRHSDPLLNGALVGAGIAIASGLFVCTRTEPWANCRDDVGPMLRIGAIGAGVGIAVDALIRGRKEDRPGPSGSARLHAAPVIARRGAGVRMSVIF